MLCGCDCGEKFTGISFTTAFTEPLSIGEVKVSATGKMRMSNVYNAAGARADADSNTNHILTVTLTPPLP